MLKRNNILYKVLVVLVFIPVIVILAQSIIIRYEYTSLLPEKISIISFNKLFTSKYLSLLISSILMSMLASIMTIILSIPVSSILSEVSKKWKNTLYVILLMPILVPQFVYFYGLQNVFMKLNIINTYIGVILSHIIAMMPYAILNISNDMSLYKKKYSEVAYILNISDYRFCLDILLPLIKNTFINTFALLFVISFSQYFLTLIIGGGVVKTYATYMLPLIIGNDRNLAAKAAFVYMMINIIFYMIYVKRDSKK